MNTNKLICKAYAKLNLTLDITGKRQDGYHIMDMLMTTVSLADEVTVEKTNDCKIEISCSDPALPNNEKNLAYRAAEEFYKSTQVQGGCKIHIEKKIPAQAGMGGGSADGAAVLVALNQLYNLGLTKTALARIGLQVGADVPFLVYGGAARVRGIGEMLTALSDLPKCAFVVCMPDEGISTAEAFAAYDKLENPVKIYTDRAQQGIDENNYLLLAENLANAMELALDPEGVEQLKNKLMKQGADNAAMTGSGAAVFGIFRTVQQAEQASKELDAQNIKNWVCVPTDCGVRVESAAE